MRIARGIKVFRNRIPRRGRAIWSGLGTDSSIKRTAPRGSETTDARVTVRYISCRFVRYFNIHHHIVALTANRSALSSRSTVSPTQTVRASHLASHRLRSRPVHDGGQQGEGYHQGGRYARRASRLVERARCVKTPETEIVARAFSLTARRTSRVPLAFDRGRVD